MPLLDIAWTDVALCALAGFAASIVGGLAGYGTGLLMPLVLVPIVGPEPVVPIIGVMALFTNAGRIAAFRDQIDWPKVGRILLLAIPFTVIATRFYDSLSGRGVLVLLGVTLLLLTPLRRLLKRAQFTVSSGALLPFGALFGLLVGGTTGAGVLLISLLMSMGMTPAAVIATDAAISITVGVAKSASFAALGALTPAHALFAVIIGLAAFPGGYVARWLMTRLSIGVHAAILDGAVIMGGAALLWRAWRG
jgi:uncharacterized membrane protein YfcA